MPPHPHGPPCSSRALGREGVPSLEQSQPRRYGSSGGERCEVDGAGDGDAGVDTDLDADERGTQGSS